MGVHRPASRMRRPSAASVLAILLATMASSALAQRTRSWCFSGALMCRGSSTTARSVYGHSITVTSDMLAYTFGGQSGDKSSSTYASSYGEEFNPTGFSLSTLTISGSTSVIPRSGHAATAWSARNGTKYVVVFGGMGFNTSSVLLNDVQVLDASSRSWVTYFAGTNGSTNTVPAPRQQASIAVLGTDVLAVYGGLLGNGSYASDLWFFNLVNLTWWGPVVLSGGRGVPGALARVAMTSISSDFLVLTGGWTATPGSLTYPAPSPPGKTPNPPQQQQPGPTPPPPPPSTGTPPPTPPPPSPNPPQPPSPPSPTITTPTVQYSLSSATWVIDCRSAPWTRQAAVSTYPLSVYSVNMQAASSAQVMPGFDSTIIMSSGDLVMVVSGGAATSADLLSNLNRQSTWHQWLSVSRLGGFNASVYSALTGTVASTTLIPGNFSRTRLWTSAPFAQLSSLTNVDGSAVDLSTRASNPAWPVATQTFVKDAGLALFADTNKVMLTGGVSESGNQVSMVSSSVLFFDASFGSSVSLDASIQPSSYLSSDGSSTTIYRSMVSLDLANTGQQGSVPAVAFLGQYDTGSAAMPDLSAITVSSVATATTLATCTAGAQLGSCASLNLTHAGGPVPRDYYTVTASQLTFNASFPLNGSQMFSALAPVMLFYGGVSVSGGPAFKFSGPSDGSSSLRTALQACDTSNALSATYVSTLATCAWKRISASASPAGGGASGSGGSSGSLNALPSQPAGRRLMQETEFDWMTYGTAAAASHMYAARPEARVLQAASPPSNSPAQPVITYVNQPIVAVYQSGSSNTPLQSRRPQGPAFLFVTATNLTGGSWHSPGPRSGAAATVSRSQETILFGGLTYANSNATDANVTTSSIQLSNDIHILKLWVGGQTITPLSINACHSNRSSDCVSVSNVTRRMAAIPATAPLANSTAAQPVSTTTYCCQSGGAQQYQMSITYSRATNLASAQGFQLIDWSDGSTVLTSATPAWDGWQLLGNTVAPGQQAVFRRNVTLTDGLYQLILTSETGSGWLDQQDVQPCCQVGVNNPVTTCCPQVQLQALSCGNAQVLPSTVWDDRNASRTPGNFTYQRRFGLRLCTGPQAPSTPTAQQYIQYPLEQRGVYLQSYEVQVAVNSSLPAARHRHAITLVSDTMIQSTWGSGGILVMFGGTTDPDAKSFSLMRNDLWVFFLSNRTWVQITPQGSPPPPRQGHSIATYQSQVVVAGGEFYNATTRTWQQDSSVYALDFSLSPSVMQWRVISGGAGTLLNSTSQTPAVSSMFAVQSVNQWWLQLPTSLYYIPITDRFTLGNSGLVVNRTLSAASLANALSTVYDGDTLLFDNVQTINVPRGVVLTITAGVLIQGNTYTSGPAGQNQGQQGSTGRRLYRVETDTWEFVEPTSAKTAQSQPDTGLADIQRGSSRELLQAPQAQQAVLAAAPATGALTLASAQQLLTQYMALWGNAFTIVDCGGTASTAFSFTAGTSTLSNVLVMNCINTSVVVSGSGTAVKIQNSIFYNNTGVYGGAIRVEGGATLNITDSVLLWNNAQWGAGVAAITGSTLLLLDSVTFHGNAQGASTNTTASGGGAVYVGQACVGVMQSVTFASNGVTGANGASNLVNGGGLWMDGPLVSTAVGSCAPVLTNTLFQGNAVQQAGGAVAITNIASTTTIQLTGCSFTNNTAGGLGSNSSTAPNANGGALLLRTVYGAVQINNSTFTENFARRSGGAVSASLVAVLTASRSTFNRNMVILSEGGAWYSEKDGQHTITQCTFNANDARFGGAVAPGRDVQCSISNSTFTGNRAQGLGGAVEANTCTGLSVTRCSFAGNSAQSGGAMALLSVPSVIVTGCQFTNNAANTTGSSATACSRTAVGAGGAICTASEGTQSISGSVFSDNTATNGGALFVSLACNINTDGSCQPVALGQRGANTYTRNTAPNGGGGVAWLYESNQASFTCVNGTALSSAADRSCAEWITSGNNASYGPGLATSATAIRFTTPVSGQVLNYLSSSVVLEYLNVTVEVNDFYGQTILGGSSEAAAQFTAVLTNQSLIDASVTGYSGALSGTTLQSAVRGSATFNNLRLKGRPGNYTITYAVSGLLHSLPPTRLMVSARSCLVGETTNTAGDECNPCEGEFFTVSSSNLTCDACPTDTASCDYTGKSDEDVPVGAVVVPLAGYWHSSPLSPQIHVCPVEAACTESSRVLLTQYQKDLVYGNRTLNVTEYNQLQCNDGYTGNLCGACLDGYGRQGDGTCAKCPPIALNTLYYVLVNFVSIIMIAITIKAQLHPEEESKEEDGQDKGDTQPAGHESGSAVVAASDTGSQEKPPDAGMREESMSRPLASMPSKMLNDSFQGLVDEKAMQEVHDDNKLSSPPHSIAIKVLINYLQVAAIISSVNLQWPEAISNFLTAADSVSNGVGTMVSMDCSLTSKKTPKSVQTAVINLTTPIIIFLGSYPVWYILWLRHRRKQGPDAMPFRPYMKNRLIITAISVIFYFYSDVTTQLLSFFSCPAIDVGGDGVPYGQYATAVGDFWSQDYNMKCYEGPHLALVLILGVPGVLLFSIGVPVASAFFLRRHLKRLHTKAFLAEFSFLYGDYEDKYYYWESVIMLRKFVLVVVVIFLVNEGTDMQLLVTLAVIIAAMVAHMTVEPFRMQRLDVLERLSLWGSTLIIYIALYFVVQNSTMTLRRVMSVVLVLCNVTITAYLVLQIGREWLWTIMRDMDVTEDEYLSRADLSRYIDKAVAKDKKSDASIGHTVRWFLDTANRRRWLNRPVMAFVIYPCEWFNPPPVPAPADKPSVLPLKSDALVSLGSDKIKAFTNTGGDRQDSGIWPGGSNKVFPEPFKQDQGAAQSDPAGAGSDEPESHDVTRVDRVGARSSASLQRDHGMDKQD